MNTNEQEERALDALIAGCIRAVGPLHEACSADSIAPTHAHELSLEDKLEVTKVRTALFRDTPPSTFGGLPLSMSRHLGTVLERIRDAYGFDAGMIYLVDLTDMRLRCAASIGCTGLGIENGHYSYDLRETTLVTQVFLEGRGRFVADEHLTGEASATSVTNCDVRGPLAGVPLSYDGQVVGVLISWSRLSPPPSPAHIEWLRPFTDLSHYQSCM